VSATLRLEDVAVALGTYITTVLKKVLNNRLLAPECSSMYRGPEHHITSGANGRRAGEANASSEQILHVRYFTLKAYNVEEFGQR
jgi:hypothetical protein